MKKEKCHTDKWKVMPASLFLVLLVNQLAAEQPIGGNCKQCPGKMADGYPTSYDGILHLLLNIYFCSPSIFLTNDQFASMWL